MTYKDYEIEDFLQDDFFVSWVTNKDPYADQFWSSWLEVNPDKRADVQMARELISNVGYGRKSQLSSEDRENQLDKILHYHDSSKMKKHIRRWIGVRWYKVAASVVLVSCVLFYMGRTDTREAPQEVAQVWKVIHTNYGQKKIVHLPDGTKVVMNSGSTIKYPVPFSTERRGVEFSGEGFFEVTRQPERPFVIQSSSLKTSVLGTSFNIRAFVGEQSLSVSVVTGKVKVETEKGDMATLLPDDRGIYDTSSGSLSREVFDKTKTLAWTEGILLFENEELPEIFRQLEKWYGVQFAIESGVNLSGKYSGQYKGKSLELVLEGLSYTSKFNFSINNQTVKIYEKTTID